MKIKAFKIPNTGKKCSVAKEILINYWDGMLPVDSVSIAEKMGIVLPFVRRLDVQPTLNERFYDAHSLGLHVNNNDDCQANKFAIELLLPVIAVEYFVFSKKIESPAKLSKLFTVPPDAMKSRLTSLGLL